MKSILQVIFCKYVLIIGFVSSISFANEIDSKNMKISAENFVQEINKNSIPFSKYDSPMSQFMNFFGLKVNYESNEKINYDDLLITVDSKNTRSLYYKKLENMTTNKNKNTNFFYLNDL